MTRHLPEPLLAELSEFISAHMGLLFVRERWPDLERGMQGAAAAFGFSEVAACAEWLLSSSVTRNQIETLADSLTVGETYFFRDPGIFEILQKHILPGLIETRRTTGKQLRIWSAGCCTGEEPYSLAMLISQLIPDWRDWQISLLATDINSTFLKKASEGIYSDWSFRNIQLGIKEHYFAKLPGKRFELKASIKTMVKFAYLNLAEDAYPTELNHTQNIDLLLCRNVLMYFSPQQMHHVIDNFHRSLANNGWLIVSPTEASHTLFRQFKSVPFSNTTLYQKTNDVSQLPHGFDVSQFTNRTELAKWEPPLPTKFVLKKEWLTPAADVLTQEPSLAANTHATPPPFLNSFEAAQTLYQQGRYAEAQVAALELLVSAPDDPKVIMLLARICANQGALPEALTWCEKAVTLDRLSAVGYYFQAVIYQELHQIDLAVQSLGRALYLDPEMALAHFALGNLALRKGKAREADRHFGNALTLLSKYPPDEILPESDGLTVGRIREMIKTTVFREPMV